MKLNNKGFAVSTVMYMILIVAVILIVLTLSVLGSRKLILDRIRQETTDSIYNKYGISYRNTLNTLKEASIEYAEKNNLDNGSIAISDLDLSISEEVLDGYDLSDKYITFHSNNSSYNVYLGKANTITDISKPLNDFVDIIDYKIYGNSVQDGTPTFDSPIEIESVGDIVTDTNDSNYGKYRISVQLSDTENSNKIQVSNIYLDEPLRKIKEYSDYIDFKNQEEEKYINELVVTGDENNWGLVSGKNGNPEYYRFIISDGKTTSYAASRQLCNYSPLKIPNSTNTTNGTRVTYSDNSGTTDMYTYFSIRNYPSISSLDDMKSFLRTSNSNGQPLRIIYTVYDNRKRSYEISIPLNPVYLDDLYNNISINTSIQPSEVEFTIIEKIKQL